MSYTRWTEHMDKRLGALWDEDCSVNEISRILTEEFQSRLSRNAIVGRLHRLGLPSRKNPVAPVPQLPPLLLSGSFIRCKWLMGRVDRPEAVAPRRRRGGIRPTPQLPREAIKDPDPAFSCWAEVPQCENQAHPGHVYCAAHCMRAYPNFALMARAAE